MIELASITEKRVCLRARCFDVGFCWICVVDGCVRPTLRGLDFTYCHIPFHYDKFESLRYGLRLNIRKGEGVSSIFDLPDLPEVEAFIFNLPSFMLP